jgi:predicted metalloprotease with PDZ domain
MIRYQIKPIHPEAHLLEVRLEVSDADSPLTLYLPAWIRGSYMIRDFARHVVSLEVADEQGKLDSVKLDKQTWLVSTSLQGVVSVTYRIYAWELSVREAHVDTTHAYFNGPSVFLAVTGRENEPCQVVIERPVGARYENWKLAVSMQPVDTDSHGFGLYRVEDYETLIDHPVEMSDFSEASFAVKGKQHRFVAHGRHAGDLQRVCKDLARICSEQVALFGELPVEEYLFLLWVVGSGYGGLEHKNSTSLMIDRNSLPVKSESKMTPAYRRLLALCSHEYFHLWNVKRITPESFLQQGTVEEVYTRQLWIFEGITSYYDELMLHRSGVIETKDYFEMLAESVTRVMRGSGRLKQTLEESSFDAWTKFYKQDENAPNAIVSYYAKGTLVALLLDLSIRLRSEGQFSLDSLMRELWQRYGRVGIGLPERAFEILVEEVTGLDFTPEFNRWLRSTEDLPLEEVLRAFGIEIYFTPADSTSDMGGVLNDRPESNTAPLVLGAKWQQRPGAILLQQVFDDGAVQQAGLSAGDEIVALDGLRLDGSQIESYLNQLTPGSCVTVHAFRRDELHQFEVTPLPAAADTCRFYLQTDLDPEIRQRQQAWLSGHATRD